MLIKWGAYAMPYGRVAVQIKETPERNARGDVVRHRVQWVLDVKLGSELSGTIESIRDIEQQTATLEAAFAADGRDLTIVKPDGTTHSTQLLASECDGSTRVDDIAYPKGTATELSTMRTVRVTISGLRRFAARSSDLYSFAETLDFGEAGARDVHIETLRHRPQKQRARRHQVFTATQQGKAVGLDAYPQVPRPIWPSALVSQLPSYKLGEQKQEGDVVTRSPISWRYRYKSAFILRGRPQTWSQYEP
jgi:hypothetical protein